MWISEHFVRTSRKLDLSQKGQNEDDATAVFWDFFHRKFYSFGWYMLPSYFTVFFEKQKFIEYNDTVLKLTFKLEFHTSLSADDYHIVA